MQFIQFGAGYVNCTQVNGNNVYRYVYNYSDHLGNNRVSYTFDSAATTPGLVILEESNYYPYGLRHMNYNMTYRTWSTLTEGGPLGITQGSVEYAQAPGKFKYKYNSQEWQGDFGYDMTAMDFRHYDNAIGRFLCMDALAPLMPNFSPYSFAFNNPVYFSDPSGLAPAMNALELANKLFEYSGSGETVWVNEGDGLWMVESSSSGSGGLYDTNADQFTMAEALKSITIFLPRNVFQASLSFWRQVQSHAYETRKYYKNHRDKINSKRISSFVDSLANILQDTGDFSMLIGTVLVVSGVGAPFGAALIYYGTYTSLTGTALDLVNDIHKGEWSNEKFLTKTVLEILPTPKFGGKFFKYLEAENATEVLNAGTIVADRTLDLFRDNKVGPYREN